MALVTANESKEIRKKFEELWINIIDLIRSITNNSDNNVEKYLKIRFNLPLKKTLELCNMVIVVRAAFHKGNKY